MRRQKGATMRGLPGIAAVTMLVAVTVACNTSKPAEVASAGPAFRLTGSVKDIMDAVVDPNADVIWDSVATTISRAGTDEKMPRTDEEWKQVRRSAIALLEATNLLLIEGRRIANPGDKSENPEIELEPEAIQKLMDADRNAWVKYAHGLHDAAMVTLKAIDAKNVQALQDSGAELDVACENCHLHYWYPDQKQPS
jgi:hypothetical protein